MTVTLDSPLPSDARVARALLDDAARALWGATEWKAGKRRRKRMPDAWRASMLHAHDEREAGR